LYNAHEDVAGRVPLASVAAKASISVAIVNPCGPVPVDLLPKEIPVIVIEYPVLGVSVKLMYDEIEEL
jgi:hypothetical protein